MSENIYYFDKPTIGYCSKCDKLATYTDKLQCPNNAEHELSLFKWDGDSPHPEGN